MVSIDSETLFIYILSGPGLTDNAASRRLVISIFP